MTVRYVRELSQGNNFPVIMSKIICPRYSPQTSLFKRIVRKKVPPSNAQEIYVQEICPWNFSSGNMSKRPLFKKYARMPCTRKMSKIIVLVAHADWPMCSAQCPPPIAMGYVHKLCERWMPPCDGSEPWIFLMRMVVVDIATPIYSTSAVKST